MNKNLAYALLAWNALLTALVVWLLMKPSSPEAPPVSEDTHPTAAIERDSVQLAEARIAFFFMDSVRSRFELVKEQGERYRSEGRRLESNLEREMMKAQNRYEELMRKDQTYSTQAEMQKDQAELQQLVGKIEELQAQSQRQMVELEASMLTDISNEIIGFLEEFNAVAGYDYIFSVEPGGQIWVGNPALDLTRDMVDGLNQRHKARKAAK